MDEADLFSPGKAPKMSKTARKDSRARPPPILIEGSSPPPVPSLVVHESKNDAEAEVADDGAVPRGLGLERSSTPTNDETTPGSPWRPLDLHQSPVMSPTRRQQSTGSRPPSWHRASLEVPSLWIPPALPTSPERGANRFEHHARNLSIYYPQPDGPRAPPSPTLEVPGDSLIPAGDRKAYGGPADWQFGSPRPEGTADDLESPDIPRGKRRGHHVSTTQSALTEAQALPFAQFLLLPRPDSDEPDASLPRVSYQCDGHARNAKTRSHAVQRAGTVLPVSTAAK